MTFPPRHGRAALAAVALLAGCAARIDYRPDDGALQGLTRRQREQVFVETISRAVKPRIVQVWIDDVSYGHDAGRVVRGGFGIPVGQVPVRRIVYFANVGRLQLFTNDAVFVYDTSGRVLDKLVFANRADAQYAMDVIAAYRARRLSVPRQERLSDDRDHRRDRRRDRGPSRDRDRRDDYDDRDDYGDRYDPLDRYYDRRYEFD